MNTEEVSDDEGVSSGPMNQKVTEWAEFEK